MAAVEGHLPGPLRGRGVQGLLQSRLGRTMLAAICGGPGLKKITTASYCYYHNVIAIHLVLLRIISLIISLVTSTMTATAAAATAAMSSWHPADLKSCSVL